MINKRPEKFPMKNKYRTKKDLVDRLDSTLCRFKGIPVFVSYKSEKSLVLYDMLSGDMIETVKVDDPNLDISSPELGYVNYRGMNGTKVLYASRSPLRRYRQGLCRQTLGWKTIDGAALKEDYPEISGNVGLFECLMDDYPPIGFVLSSGMSLAVSRDVAIEVLDIGLRQVYFKNTLVGWINPEDVVVNIKSHWSDWIVERKLSLVGLETKKV